MIYRALVLFLTTLFLLVAASEDACAQRGRKKRSSRRNKSEFRKMKGPKIRKKDNGAERFKRNPAYRDKVALALQDPDPTKFVPPAPTTNFNPYKALSLVSEDTISLEDGETSIVEVSEEVKVDSSWVKIAEYYSLWSSNIIDPYRIDRDELTEPVLLLLYDSLQGRLWSMPQRKTMVNSRFGPRGYRFHSGVDLELDMFDSIYAAFDGVVRVSAYQGGGYGNVMVLRHYNGLETVYAHLSMPVAKIGQYVKAGELIGWGGTTGRSSGPHLHYEVRYQGKTFNPDEIYDFTPWTIRGASFVLTPAMMQLQASSGSRKVYWHRVRSGDTMFSIARKYGVSVATLARLNGMSKSSSLRSGKRLRIR